MRRKILIAAWLVALMLTAGTFYVARAVLTRSFADIEADTVHQGVHRVRKAVEVDLSQLDTAVSDYAIWDDAYSYILKRNSKFVDDNFSRTALENLRIDVVWIIDKTGVTVFSVGGGELEGDSVLPLTMLEQDVLRRYQPRMGTTGSSPPLDRLLRMPSGLLAFSASPILRGDRSGPAVGMLLFGRYLHDDEIQRATQMSQLPITLAMIDSSYGKNASLPDAIQRWALSAPNSNSYPEMQTRNSNTSFGYTVLRDVTGEPVAVLSMRIKRDVLMLGRRTITGVIVALVLGFGCVVIGLILIINRTWRARDSTETRYQNVVQQLDESILLANADTGLIVEANPAVLRTLGYETSQVGQIHLDQLSPVFAPINLRRAQDRTAASRRVLMISAQDGRKVPMEITMTRLKLGQQRLVCLVARDVTIRRNAERQRRRHRRRLAHLAHHDSLTGLPNRLCLQQRLPKLIASADRNHSQLALLYLDLDHFKDVNDSLGHSSGDRLLMSVAKRLRSCVPAGDLVIRMGGDEFVVVATELPGANAVDYIARRIHEALSAPIDVDGVRLSVVASVGISMYPTDGANPEQLLKHADIALYQAKDRGRGNHQFFTDEMKANLTDRLELEHALRRGIGTDQLFLEYQPAFELNSGRPVSFEALARWNHPQLGSIPPSRFIPIAEEGNLILQLGTWVLRCVCRQLAEWRREGLPLLPVSINVTPRHFEHGRLVETVSELTREYDVDANLLHFEITESAVMQNSEQQLGALQALRKLGSRILIDDFGTGYSSLSYLKHLPIDTLKIDRAFVRDMATDPNDAAIVRAIIAVADSLGLHVVAEGIETQEQVHALMELNCSTGQGFYFSRPVSPEQCRVVLNRLNQRRLSDTSKLRILKSASLATKG